VIQQTVPAGYDVRHTSAAYVNANAAEDADFGARVRSSLNGGGLAWIYIGHGLPTQLDHAPTSGGGRQPILSTRDVRRLDCGSHPPLAVFIACYTGAMDAPRPCLAEELLLAEHGPVAVVAATRVTMPYGNTVIGYEMLRACFQDQPSELGDVLRLAQQRALSPTANDPTRATLDGMAQLLSPPPVDLVNERREHALMYHLVGDPLLRLKRPVNEVATGESKTRTVK
jgi:hypothetical protein